VSAYLDWRQKLQLQYNPTRAQDVLGGHTDAPQMYRLMPECTLGRDKARQPVLYFVFSRTNLDVNNMAEVTKRVTTKHIFDYHLWQHEALVEMFYHCSREENALICACTLVMDLEQLTTENASSEFLYIITRRADVMNQYFPYLVSKILVVNANEDDLRLIHKIRELCSTISATAGVFFSSAGKSPLDMLSQHIDPSELPAEYGGSHRHSLAALPHPFLEATRLREEAGSACTAATATSSRAQGGGRVSPLLSLHLSLPAASSSVPLPSLSRPPAAGTSGSVQDGGGSNGVSASALLRVSGAGALESSCTTAASSASPPRHHPDEEDSLCAPHSLSPSFLASVDSHSTRCGEQEQTRLPRHM
jgi:hypothetical protein